MFSKKVAVKGSSFPSAAAPVRACPSETSKRCWRRWRSLMGVRWWLNISSRDAMASKFGHQRRNRQDKVWKEPGSCMGGKESPGLWSFVVTKDHRIRQVLNREV